VIEKNGIADTTDTETILTAWMPSFTAATSDSTKALTLSIISKARMPSGAAYLEVRVGFAAKLFEKVLKKA